MIAWRRLTSRHLPCRPQRLALPHQRNQSTQGAQGTLNYSPLLRPTEEAPNVPKKPSHYYPTIATSPAAECDCSPIRLGLDIEREGPMAMPEYSRHVIIMTGRNDWQSRIEDEESSVLPSPSTKEEEPPRANLAKSLKELVGLKGKYYHPERKILITNCNMSSQSLIPQKNEVMIFPQHVRVGGIWNDPADHDAFCETFLMTTPERDRLVKPTGLLAPQQQHGQETQKSHDDDDDDDDAAAKRRRRRREKHISFDLSVNDAPVILVCTHHSRDRRCGIIGRQLADAFMRYTRSPDVQDRLAMDQGAPPPADRAMAPYDRVLNPVQTIVSCVSHVGGHKWAGNVIVYLPPGWRTKAGEVSPLARKGVWYGRVEVKHVAGIVEETIRGGKIIEDLCRGLHESLAPITNRQRVGV